MTQMFLNLVNGYPNCGIFILRNSPSNKRDELLTPVGKWMNLRCFMIDGKKKSVSRSFMGLGDQAQQVRTLITKQEDWMDPCEPLLWCPHACHSTQEYTHAHMHSCISTLELARTHTELWFHWVSWFEARQKSHFLKMIPGKCKGEGLAWK